MNRTMTARATSVAVMLALALAGCGNAGQPVASNPPNDQGALGDKAGGQASTVTLKAIVGDPKGSPGTAEQMAAFAAKVEALSNGALKIDITFGAYDAFSSSPVKGDVRIVELVQDGTHDIAAIPARSWEYEEIGETRMRALSAPFLVESNALTAKIATTDLADELMSGLPALGLTGLALLPDTMRHPVGFTEPLVAPADYAGKGIRSAGTPTVDSIFRELGADPLSPADWWTPIQTGEIVGADASYSFLYLYPPNSFVTGNVTTYAKMNTIMAGSARFDRLTEAQRAILKDAAAATLDESLAAIPAESAAAVAACEGGATVVLAGDADLAALKEAVEPVYAELEKNPETKAVIAAIRALKATTPSADIVKACQPASATSSPEPSLVSDDQSVLNGTYRQEHDADSLRALGTAEAEIPDWVGIVTLEIHDGTWDWSLRQEHPVHEPWHASGIITVNADTASTRITSPRYGPGGEDLSTIEDTYRWTLTSEALTLKLEDSTKAYPESQGDAAGTLGGTWTRLP
jgi:TRAP-type C4-dicarboxylate transport system substrate-binding protein